MSKVSIIVSTNRPRYWERFCGHLIRNSTDLEVIFVGPISRSSVPLPRHARFIHSNANPALCWEIGARRAEGDLICFAPDDICFTDGFFDAAADAASRMKEFDMLTARYFHNGADQFGGMRLMSVPDMPLTPVCGVMFTRSHHKLGGVDRRFNAVLWDADLYMRFYEAGGRTQMIPGYTCNEVSGDSQMFVNNYHRDLEVIKDLWYVNDRPQLRRKSPVQSYQPHEAVGNEI